MIQAKIRSRALPAAVACTLLAACGGGSKVGNLAGSGRAELLSIEIGRVVDVYSYQRVNETIGDRRLRTNRHLELVARDVAINGNIEGQSLFDASGNVVATANYEFLPYDKSVGHEELVILWDNRKGAEQSNFDAAFTAAQNGLAVVPASYRGQNTVTRPIPVVPRNAAIVLKFSSSLDVDPAFFAVNPSAIQLLEFKGDPAVVNPADAFRVLPYRVIPQGTKIILDTTILGGEVGASGDSPGLPASSDSVTANIRIAIPSRGQVAPNFNIKVDSVPQLDSVDSAGRDSVIRDFRSGNLADGVAGRLREPEMPMIVAPLSMGITGVDADNGVITLNKRLQFVPVRGRYPFVDGPLDASGIPLGPLAVPTQRALPHGDYLTQVVQVSMPDGTTETVSLRAEVLENLEVGTTVGDPSQPTLGLAANAPVGDTGQGELLPTVRLRVASAAPARDSLGRPVTFQASALPLGQDCLLRALYYESVPFTSGGNEVSDLGWRNLFVRIEPKPTQAGVDLQPSASVSVEFTKPMDLDQIDNTKNLLITNTPSSLESFAQQMTDPKRQSIHVVPTRLADLSGDGTVLRLQPQMGFYHRSGQSEAYSVHVRLGSAGVTDLAGNTLQVFDNPNSPVDAWSVDFSLAPSANDNLVGWYVFLAEAEDGDGSLPGSVDMFGQYRLENGRLIAASGVRFSRSADQQHLSTVSRINRGECWDDRDIGPTPNTQLFPQPNPPAGVVPIDPATGAPHPGLLYWTPYMSDSIGPNPIPAPQVYEYWQTLAQPVGRIVEPLKPQGSRMQMRYLDDDFSMSYRQPSEFGIDVEQLYWAPFNDENVRYDVFDRFTMSLGHARTRPDERWLLVYDSPDPAVANAFCTMDCASMNSSLSLLFSDNVLEGSQLTPVFEDKVYKINPNDAFRTIEQVKYVPYPRFDHTYTWRDSRLVTVDASGAVIGLGGALQPQAAPPTNDTTANVDSPWIVGTPDPEFVAAGGASWVRDSADFVGSNQRDHDPIALPLLVDMKVFPDDAANGIAAGNNGFQVALLGPPSAGFPPQVGSPGGYYDSVGSGCGNGFPAWPRVRVHASGGFDLINGSPILIDPANQLSAQASVVKDAGLGSSTTALFTAPPGDGMLHWGRADFVRKQSTMTFGFFDTLKPQQYSIANFDNETIESGAGFPNLEAVSPTLRINDMLVQMDPPQAGQPAGTSVVVEIRGADNFANSDKLYNPVFTGFNGSLVPDDTFDGRGNLLNPNYACEAYRYSTANQVSGAPRVAAQGLTRYVTEDQLNLIRNPATGLLPRFMNIRLVMTNNVTVSPALSPSIRSLSIVYRLQPNQ